MEIPGELLREITNTILKSVHDKDKLYEKIDNEMIKKSDSRVYRLEEDELVNTVELDDKDMTEEQIEKELEKTAMEPIDWWFEKVEVQE